MGRRRHISRAMRIRIWEADKSCPFCGEIIEDLKLVRVEVSHTIPLELGGADEERNMRVAHYECHREHTAKVDIPMIAKAKRVRAKHTGTFRPPRHIVPGSKASPWKKTLRGKVERRMPKEDA